MAKLPLLQVIPIGNIRRASNEESTIEVLPEYIGGLHGIAAGDWLDVLYWMHQLGPDERKMLKVHPRGDRSRPLKGVFALRSPMRPNPIGVSTVRVLRIDKAKLYVSSFDAKDGSPVIDIKASRGHSS